MTVKLKFIDTFLQLWYTLYDTEYSGDKMKFKLKRKPFSLQKRFLFYNFATVIFPVITAILSTKLWKYSNFSFIIAVLLFASIVTPIGIIIIQYITTKSVIVPIENLNESAHKIKMGILDEPVIIDNNTYELEELSRNFEEMRQRLKQTLDEQIEYENEKRATFSGLNHDARTAITTIKGYSQGLIDGIANTPEKQQRYLSAILNATYSLEKLMDALSDINNLETGNIPFNFKEIDMFSLTTDWYNESKSILSERGILLSLTYNSSKRAFCNIDTFQIERVIDNVLNNCAKYKKPESDHIDVSITVGISDDNMLEMVYQDNGIGINFEDSNKIFDMFYRADEARSNVRSGNGLGLAIVKQIILRHGGSISASGEIGKGLTLTSKLPIIKTQEM